MQLNPRVLQMMRDRPATKVWLTLAEADEVRGFDDLARRAGLKTLGRAWVEVDEKRARRFLTGLLHRDLAYKSAVLAEERAEWLADEFLLAAGKHGSRFATNSPDMPHEFPFSWTPASDHTIDAGVAVIGGAGSGLYWVADED